MGDAPFQVGLIFRGGVGAYFQMRIVVSKLSGFLFGWDTITEIVWCIQECHIVKLSEHNDMKPETNPAVPLSIYNNLNYMYKKKLHNTGL